MSRNLYNKIIALFLFAVAMAFLESTVVVYLRELYYPEGFRFPLKEISDHILLVELLREAATIIMLLTAGYLAGKKNWERFGAFVFLFGIWDIFYYIFLKLVLDWPTSIFDLDILFLIPLPWIAPIIAPLLISLLMIITGLYLLKLYETGKTFIATRLSWLAAFIGTALILYSFMRDPLTGVLESVPGDYAYWLLVAGLLIYGTGLGHALHESQKNRP